VSQRGNAVPREKFLTLHCSISTEWQPVKVHFGRTTHMASAQNAIANGTFSQNGTQIHTHRLHCWRANTHRVHKHVNISNMNTG